jgi:hypothetical protein
LIDLSVQVNSIFVPVPVALKSVGLDGAAAVVGCCGGGGCGDGGGGGCDVGALLVAVETAEVVAVAVGEAVGVSVVSGTVAEGPAVKVDIVGTVAVRVGVFGAPIVMLMGAHALRPATVHSARKTTIVQRSRDESMYVLLLPG